MGYPDSSTPTFVDYNGPSGARDAYPAWSAERQIPLSKEEIEDIFLDLTQKFGFQRDSMRNMVSNDLFPAKAMLGRCENFFPCGCLALPLSRHDLGLA